MEELLAQFMRAFERAIASEMAAMRERMGPFEVEVSNGRECPEAAARAAGSARFAYEYELNGPDDKLVAGAECTLRRPGGEVLVTIAELGGSQGGPRTITLLCDRMLRGADEPASLVLYPWFLYEKLRDALADVARDDGYFVESGLRAFGKIAPVRTPTPLRTDVGALNTSQREAVALCAENDLAFVWGPPGSGKTHTLARIAEELVAQGQRVLLTSTTNAAVDQALAKLAESPDSREAIERGDVVRIGRSDAPTHGAALAEVVARQGRALRERLAALRVSEGLLRERLAACDAVLEQIEAAVDSAQGNLFGEPEVAGLSPSQVSRIFSPARAAGFADLPASEQRRCVRRRRAQLLRAQDAAKERGSRLAGLLVKAEAEVVSRARLVLATMTNAYFSRLLEGERYDAVIIEEAGMAILPTLFYCATLARSRVILIGDPRQLPPIVQSREPHVHRSMGRSIFEVTVPDPHRSPSVALLDTQYRMHPAIGDLVSRLYYEGALQSHASTRERSTIAALAPFPGRPIVVHDTGGQTTCANPPGSSSRFNERSSAICVDLVREASEAGIDSIAVITPYAEQSRQTRRALREAGLLRKGVECSTVHRFQGNERDLVILDAVDASPLRPGILLASRDDSSRKLLNVSLSRARGKLVLVADVAYFESRASGSAIHEALQAALLAAR